MIKFNNKNSEYLFHIHVASLLKKIQLSGVDFLFWHTPNGESRSKAAGGRLKLMGVLAGVPDLCLMMNGRLIFIELKRGTGTTSKPQGAFIASASKHGFKTFVISEWGALTNVLSDFLQKDISSISAKVFESYMGMVGSPKPI